MFFVEQDFWSHFLFFERNNGMQDLKATERRHADVTGCPAPFFGASIPSCNKYYLFHL